MQTYLGRSINYALNRISITQQQLADRSNLLQPTIARIISKGIRATPESLNALTHCWDPITNMRICVAHLRDEIERMGHDNTLIDMKIKGTSATNGEEDDIEVIKSHIADDQNLAALIHDLALLIKSADRGCKYKAEELENSLVADNVQLYGSKKKKK